MPWINEEECIGCGICVDECVTGAIEMEGDKARMDMGRCIRCGICHDACPEGAFHHDSETIPLEVASNVEYTKSCMEACVRLLGSSKEGTECLARCIKHFRRAKKVAERTLEELDALQKSLA